MNSGQMIIARCGHELTGDLDGIGDVRPSRSKINKTTHYAVVLFPPFCQEITRVPPQLQIEFNRSSNRNTVAMPSGIQKIINIFPLAE
ncbi:unnamed protein product [Linum trigynum]|uniref:Uncharacterized protein n=1 Tax=Linum trigynum TaxID=586398 RepID=A0AAV2DT15_9ROSI